MIGAIGLQTVIILGGVGVLFHLLKYMERNRLRRSPVLHAGRQSGPGAGSDGGPSLRG
jgi:hypothetical protein